MAIDGIALAWLVLAGACLSYFLLGSHRATSEFTLSASPGSGSADALGGTWKVAAGSQVGYRAREQFINQPAPTEAVARTSKVAGAMQIPVAGPSLRLSSIDFTPRLSRLLMPDK